MFRRERQGKKERRKPAATTGEQTSSFEEVSTAISLAVGAENSHLEKAISSSRRPCPDVGIHARKRFTRESRGRRKCPFSIARAQSRDRKAGICSRGESFLFVQEGQSKT